jgi:protein-disulfide isomerase
VNIRQIGIIAVSLLLIGGVACSQSSGGWGKRGGLSQEQTETVIKEYILKNPEVLVQSLQSMQQKQMDDARKSIQKTQEIAPNFADGLFHTAKDPSIGNPNGAVTIVEFFDYQCAHCTRMHTILDSLVKSDPNLRIVYKEFPIRGPVSELAARAALAAQNQNKFMEVHDGLMKAAQQQLPLTDDIIYKVAAAAGVNVTKLKEDMHSQAISDQLAANNDLGQRLQLIGTPAFFIAKSDVTKNSSPQSVIFVPGQIDLVQLQSMVKKARQ